MRAYAVETIVAIATPPGRGGIGIVRVSGFDLASFAFKLINRMPTARHAQLADFTDRDGCLLDKGLLLYFPAPHSFTGEDVIELQGHGGPAVMQSLLARCIELGARLAAPGEFSQRAFLNDKMDLAQAEAVADLIDASSIEAARSALRSLSGVFSSQVRDLVTQLTELRMLVEATLDFPEEEIDVLRDTDAAERLTRFRDGLEELQSRARQGSVLRSGIHVVLTGLPNVGKSSLLNALSGSDRAIVTEVAGTTRDTLRETILIEGVPLHVIDTAGLRDTQDIVERIGVERAWVEIERADVVLQLVDARGGVTAADHAIAVRLPTRAERVVVENKIDLAAVAASRSVQGGQVHIRLCAKSGDGVELLRQELLRIAGWHGGEDVILARERHLRALAVAAEKSALAARHLGQIEVCAEELRIAQSALSEITGDFSADDLLGEIFSRFCIGK
jgi:tRNA modification GTPase